jgi:hypothetical protein
MNLLYYQETTSTWLLGVDNNLAEWQGVWSICVTALEFALLLSSPFVFPLSAPQKCDNHLEKVSNITVELFCCPRRVV